MFEKMMATAVLPAADLGRAKQWWHDVLGRDPIADDEQGEAVFYEIGGTVVMVYRTQFAGTAQNTAFNLLTDDLDRDMTGGHVAPEDGEATGQDDPEQESQVRRGVRQGRAAQEDPADDLADEPGLGDGEQPAHPAQADGKDEGRKTENRRQTDDGRRRAQGSRQKVEGRRPFSIGTHACPFVNSSSALDGLPRTLSATAAFGLPPSVD